MGLGGRGELVAFERIPSVIKRMFCPSRMAGISSAFSLIGSPKFGNSFRDLNEAACFEFFKADCE